MEQLELTSSLSESDATLHHDAIFQRRKYESAAANQWLAEPVSVRGETLSNSEFRYRVTCVPVSTYHLVVIVHRFLKCNEAQQVYSHRRDARWGSVPRK